MDSLSMKGTIKRQALGSRGELLSLYDIKEDRVCEDKIENIHQLNNETKSANINKLKTIHFCEKNYTERFNHFDILIEQKASVLSSEVIFEGAANVLNLHTTDIISIILYRKQTVYEHLVTKPNNIVLKKGCCATHLIVGITYGVQMAISIECTKDDNEDLIKREILQIVAKIRENELLSHEEAQFCDGLSVHVFHDIEPRGKTEMKLSAAFEYLRNINQIQLPQNKGVPLEYTLLPLSLFCLNLELSNTFNEIPKALYKELSQYFDEIYSKVMLLRKQIYKRLKRHEDQFPDDFIEKPNYKVYKNFKFYIDYMIKKMRTDLALYLKDARTIDIFDNFSIRLKRMREDTRKYLFEKTRELKNVQEPKLTSSFFFLYDNDPFEEDSENLGCAYLCSGLQTDENE